MGLRRNKAPAILEEGYAHSGSKSLELELAGIILTDNIKSTFKDAAKKLTGRNKKDFMAKVTEDYFDGSARKAEKVLRWSRQSVQLVLHKRLTEIVSVENYQARGQYKREEILPNLEANIRSLVDAQAQADPKFKSPFLYARISAMAVPKFHQS